MRKILSANLFAMFHSKYFWLGAFIMSTTAIYAICDGYKRMVQYEDSVTLDAGAYYFSILLFVLLPALGGGFINTDYHDGTIRNKLVVGRTRGAVYLANLVTVFTVGMFYQLLYLLVYSLVGFPVFGWYQMPVEIGEKLFMLTLEFLSISAVTTLFATLIPHRVVLVLCAFIAFGMMFLAQIVNGMLSEPETEHGGYTTATTFQDNGQLITEFFDKEGNVIQFDDLPTVPNPSYVREPMRTALRTINNIHPGGQLMELIQNGHDEPDRSRVKTPYWQLAAYALGMTALSTAAGWVLFRRKDLK